MRKFKLIREYPNSLYIGTEVTFNEKDESVKVGQQKGWCYRIINIKLDEVLRYTEFWEEVIEKKKIFTTEDGVDVFEGGLVFTVNSDWQITHFCNVQKNNFYHKTFSTPAAAKEYVLLNKPLLSVNDVFNVFKESYTMNRIKLNLIKELAKFKLKKMENKEKRLIEITFDEELPYKWEFVTTNNDDCRVYFKVQKDAGFKFMAIQNTGGQLIPEYEKDNWHPESCIVEVIYFGFAYADIIRHLYMGSEQTDNFGYIYYPNLLLHIEILLILKTLEEKYCNGE
jgi:hypothetical protein